MCLVSKGNSAKGIIDELLFFLFSCPFSFAKDALSRRRNFRNFSSVYERSQEAALIVGRRSIVCCIPVHRRETHFIVFLVLVSPSTLFVDITSAEGARRLLPHFCSSLVQRNRHDCAFEINI